ncbi:MAG: riboflavin synthase subunit alpha [Betaproteobacteria bacterium RIFCSPLOWO2_02_FULL_66_14]|nr:MAG: riboflavin synthase subunit alpha [Betaproteobacteria bacterium RIFCSPLOWO2_02_FULL_66_14]
MFTGIVQAVGRIESHTSLEQGVRLTIETGMLDLAGVAIGDSICVQGCCLTVVAHAGKRLAFDVSRETLDCTVGLDRAGAVNLEKSLALGDKLGGHLVTGHVDGVGEVIAFEAAGESRLLRVRAPQALARYIARKGSVAVDGVSLTVNRVADDDFEVNLIPHTLEVTTLGRLAPGVRVNLEIDLIARYVERMLAASK